MSSSVPTVSCPGPWPRTCRTPSGPDSPPTSGRSPATASSSRPGDARPRRGRCSARPESRSADDSGSSTRTPGRSSGWSTRRCSSVAAAETDDVAVGSGAWTAVHHAFTSPKPASMDTFDTDPGRLAYAYDIVCNGNEIGGGSIRIHRRDIQERVFAVMGLDPAQARGEIRVPARGVQVRGAPARRHRLRLGPDLMLLSRHGLDPRRDRVPEVGWRLRPAHRCSGADHPRAAQGGRRRRPTRQLAPPPLPR